VTKADLAVLGRVFAAEVNGLLPAQMKSKRATALAERGYLVPDERVFGGRFPLRVTGYALSHAGRLAYCMSQEPDHG